MLLLLPKGRGADSVRIRWWECWLMMMITIINKNRNNNNNNNNNNNQTHPNHHHSPKHSTFLLRRLPIKRQILTMAAFHMQIKFISYLDIIIDVIKCPRAAALHPTEICRSRAKTGARMRRAARAGSPEAPSRNSTGGRPRG